MNDHPEEPTYQELLARVKQLERIRKFETWVLTRKKKRKKRKKKGKAKSNQRLIVSGGLPSLGKRR